MALYKKDLKTWVHPYLNKHGSGGAVSWEVNLPFMRVNTDASVELCSALDAVLDFSGIDKKVFTDYVVDQLFIKPANDKSKASEGESSISAAMDFYLGFWKNTYNSVWQTIGAIFNTRENEPICKLSAESISNRAMAIGLFITDPLVVYIIDSNEEIFDRFGFIAGGDVVYSALITEERAKRIPHEIHFNDVLAWACLHDKIKDLNDMPFYVILSVCCEQTDKINTLDEDIKNKVYSFIDINPSKKTCVDNLLDDSIPITKDIFKDLSIAEKAVLAVSREFDVSKVVDSADINEINSYLRSKSQSAFPHLSLRCPVKVSNGVVGYETITITADTTVEDLKKDIMSKIVCWRFTVFIKDDKYSYMQLYTLIKELKRLCFEQGVKPVISSKCTHFHKNMFNSIS